MRKWPYVAAFAVSALAWCFLYFFTDHLSFVAIYDGRLQLAFFTAFITIGSFLLAMKAFLLVRLKDDIYKHPEYKQRYLRQFNNQYNGNYYQGLQEIGSLLIASVIMSFVTSIAQVTIGFFPNIICKTVAASFAAGMLMLVIFDWYYVYLNLKDWLAFLEIDAKKEIMNSEDSTN